MTTKVDLRHLSAPLIFHIISPAHPLCLLLLFLFHQVSIPSFFSEKFSNKLPISSPFTILWLLAHWDHQWTIYWNRWWSLILHKTQPFHCITWSHQIWLQGFQPLLTWHLLPIPLSCSTYTQYDVTPIKMIFFLCKCSFNTNGLLTFLFILKYLMHKNFIGISAAVFDTTGYPLPSRKSSLPLKWSSLFFLLFLQSCSCALSLP